MRRELALLILLGCCGCASLPGEPAPKERDGQAYGVVPGTFRARWWSYYERGRSYLDGSFNTEARADLETALSFRTDDQRWARTYGLHFLPEYFPNRELGIVAFREGKLDEAERLLQRSLAQEKSALASYYLDQVRAARIQHSGGDREAPVIDVEPGTLAQGPDGGMQTILHVHVRDNTFVAMVKIGDASPPLDGAAPSVERTQSIALSAGTNDVKVIATDLVGNTSEKTVHIERDFDGPAISFDTPSGEVIGGAVSDPADIVELRVGERNIELQSAGAHEKRFVLPSDARGAAFLAKDALGNETRGTVPGRMHAAAALAGLHVAANLDNAHLAELVGAATAESIRLANLAEGQRYLMDEIVVSIEANTPEGIASIELEGSQLPGVVRGAKSLVLSRRIRLAALGQHTVHARVVDLAGHASEAATQIERAPTDLERPEERLRVALLGNLWEGAGPTLENETNFVAEELSSALFKGGRMEVISRDALPRVLQEQELRAVLGAQTLEPGLRQIVPADVLAVGKVRRSGDVLEIIVQAVSSETSNILAYADVAGAVANLDDLRALTRDLALRFEQEFPRVSGTVVQAPSAERCFTTLSEGDRVRPELPCVVYRLGEPIVHPQTGAVLGRPTQIVGRGTLAEVQRQMSRMQLQPQGAEGGPVQVNDHVATR